MSGFRAQCRTKQRKPNGEMNDLGTKNCGGSESYTDVPSPIPISRAAHVIYTDRGGVLHRREQAFIFFLVAVWSSLVSVDSEPLRR